MKAFKLACGLIFHRCLLLYLKNIMLRGLVQNHSVSETNGAILPNLGRVIFLGINTEIHLAC